MVAGPEVCTPTIGRAPDTRTSPAIRTNPICCGRSWPRASRLGGRAYRDAPAGAALLMGNDMICWPSKPTSNVSARAGKTPPPLTLR